MDQTQVADAVARRTVHRKRRRSPGQGTSRQLVLEEQPRSRARKIRVTKTRFWAKRPKKSRGLRGPEPRQGLIASLLAPSLRSGVALVWGWASRNIENLLETHCLRPLGSMSAPRWLHFCTFLRSWKGRGRHSFFGSVFGRF